MGPILAIYPHMHQPGTYESYVISCSDKSQEQNKIGLIRSWGGGGVHGGGGGVYQTHGLHWVQNVSAQVMHGVEIIHRVVV